jgi:hypothetical protein
MTTKTAENSTGCLAIAEYLEAIAEYRETLAEYLEGQAAWRAGKAEEYPDDDRNARSASRIGDLAAYVRALPTDDDRIHALWAIYGLEGRVSAGEEFGRAVSRLEFHHGPTTDLDGFLTSLVAREVLVESVDWAWVEAGVAVALATDAEDSAPDEANSLWRDADDARKEAIEEEAKLTAFDAENEQGPRTGSRPGPVPSRSPSPEEGKGRRDVVDVMTEKDVLEGPEGETRDVRVGDFTVEDGASEFHPHVKFGREACQRMFLRSEHFEYDVKCLACSLEFAVRSWWGDKNPASWHCPECGQQGRFLVLIEKLHTAIHNQMQGNTIYVQE